MSTSFTISPLLLKQRLQALPPLPQAALQALAALRDDAASSDHCAALIGQDQALAARVLCLANSAFYGVPGRVGHIRDAVHLLGRRTLASLLTAATLVQQFDARSCPAFSFLAFWRHTLAVALAAGGLARALRLDEEQAFTAGLLHDMGRLALAAQFPVQMHGVLLHAQQADLALHEAEAQLLGLDHVAVGALLAALWQFPPDVAAAIASHHGPQPGLPGTTPPSTPNSVSLSDVVHVADAMVHALDIAGDPHEMVPALDSAAWARLALNPRTALQVLGDTEAGLQGLCSAMGLPALAPTVLDHAA